MKKLGIIGSGDLGQLIAYHAGTSLKYEVIGFFDDFRQKGEVISGHRIIGGINDVLSSFHDGTIEELMIGIGYKHFELRKQMFVTYSSKIPMATIIHPSSYVDPSCKIGPGVFILPGCVLDRNVEISGNVLLNTGCVIAHDSIIGAHSFLSPAVKIAGFVRIGECCSIGINTTIIDNLIIADEVKTGGGCVVIKSIDRVGLYVGNPAKFIK
ncbi:MAG: hypothetical protein K0S44_2497 [Bacteroidetes bacterium]|jgi:sugar O-acyltransferase (sialic acid O-acetyltransferase NeuD family)|nr:hypothetical protein [Bacteroidota bacterium]